MRKPELLKLLELKDVSSSQLADREPQLWMSIVVHARDAVRARVAAALEAEPLDVRSHVAALDLSGAEPARLVEHVRASLMSSTLPAKSVRSAVAALDRLAPAAAVAPGVVTQGDDTRPIGEDPDLAPLLDKARLFQVGEIAKVGDDVVEAIAAEARRPSGVTDLVLKRLVAAAKLSEIQAREV